ncbi:hypothetical protein, partial [Pseudobutyrivibrio ruminis]|uniref:hypothetical protein n=1 Tax=Pseudobutyrivibrio ruminis TaxID=46206 RepID=UPI001A998CF7
IQIQRIQTQRTQAVDQQKNQQQISHKLISHINTNSFINGAPFGVLLSCAEIGITTAHPFLCPFAIVNHIS